MADDNVALVTSFYEQVVDGGKLDLIDELMSEDFVEHEPFPGTGEGREGAKAMFAMLGEAFDGLRMPIDDIIARGDKVAVRTRIQGTHRGEFMGVAPSGKQIDVPVIDILRIADGRVVEHWGVSDGMAMMEQLGAAPGP